MKTGDTVRDRQGRVYQIGPLLGRGLWGKCYGVREAGRGEPSEVREDPSGASQPHGVERVLKVPLSLEELGGRERLIKVCRTILTEQAGFLEAHRGRGFVGLERLVDLELTSPAGTSTETFPGLVLTKAAGSLDRRLLGGTTLEETLRMIGAVVQRLAEARPMLAVHGALKPQNVLLDERGQVMLSDVMTPTLRRHYSELLQLQPSHEIWVAPETRLAPGEPPLGTVTDTFSLAMILYRQILGAEDPKAATPVVGLDKAQVLHVKDTITRRLKTEASNPRFHTRVSERAGAVLNRALSREITPSPPYRFANLEELKKRLDEVWSLIQPAVLHVGRLILDRPPGMDSFRTDEEIVLSVTVGCSTGVEDHQEIGSGIAVFDAATGERKKSVPCSYTVERHPSGRFRFKYRLTELAPGGYRVRIAFAIHESGHQPSVVEALFGVHPAVGYVPPRTLPEPRAIPLHDRRNDPPTSVTQAPAQIHLHGDGMAPPDPAAAEVAADSAEPWDNDNDSDLVSPSPVEPPSRPVLVDALEEHAHAMAYLKVAGGGQRSSTTGIHSMAGLHAGARPGARLPVPGGGDDRPTRPSIPSSVVPTADRVPRSFPETTRPRADTSPKLSAEDRWNGWEEISDAEGWFPSDLPSDLASRPTAPEIDGQRDDVVGVPHWQDFPLLDGGDDDPEDLFLADKTDVNPSLRDSSDAGILGEIFGRRGWLSTTLRDARGWFRTTAKKRKKAKRAASPSVLGAFFQDVAKMPPAQPARLDAPTSPTLWSRVGDIVGSDAYRLFIAGALLLIIALLAMLLLLE